MDFIPIVGDVALMDARIYRPRPMGLAAALLDLQMTDRESNERRGEHLLRQLRGAADPHGGISRRCDGVRGAVRVRIGRSTWLPTTTAFGLTRTSRPPMQRWSRISSRRLDGTVSRHSSSAFTRMKLGRAVFSRTRAPHLFEFGAIGTAAPSSIKRAGRGAECAGSRRLFGPRVRPGQSALRRSRIRFQAQSLHSELELAHLEFAE